MSINLRLRNLLDFIRFTLSVRTTERAIVLPGSERPENDAEHSFQLALAAWYLADQEKLSLNRQLLLEYALAHDVIEAYAGDIPFFAKTTSKQEKAAREQAALAEISKRFPHFPTLHARIQQYEERNDQESRFIHALDKLLPIINNYLNEGRSWQDHQVTLADLITYKREKIAESAAVVPYFDELIEILSKNESHYFLTNTAAKQ